MLPRRSRSSFNMVEERHESKSKSGVRANISAGHPVGLRILIQHTPGEFNAVVKSSSLIRFPRAVGPTRRVHHLSYQESSFLKACYLCKKRLSPVKDIHMYRGCQGFCSVECRNRQIYIDEMREIEASTRQKMQMVSSYRENCRSSRRAGDSQSRTGILFLAVA